MLPLIVISLAVIYVVLKATGLFDDLIAVGKSVESSESPWSQRFLRWPEENDERLDVYKDFLESQQDENESDRTTPDS